MTTFTMCRGLEGTRKLKTDDLLTAVKETLNYDADLYINGTLVFSTMSLNMEDNIKTLSEYGISHYLDNDRLCFKYTDETKNIKRYYVEFAQHSFWKPVPCLDVRIHDYRSNDTDREFETLKQVFDTIKSEYMPLVALEDICINEWNDRGCFGHKLPID